MEFYVADTSFKRVALIEDYSSIIWTERYARDGDFEIYVPASEEAIDLYQPDNYILTDTTNKAMIIEDLEINTDEDGRAMLTVTGRSLESILRRRILWGLNVYDGARGLVVGQIVKGCLGGPAGPDREVTQLSWVENLVSGYHTSISTQFTGTNCYEAVVGLLDEASWGFQIEHIPDEGMIGQLREGVDRSQMAGSPDFEPLPAIIFSENHGNLESTNYIMSTRQFKTDGLVGGEGEGIDRRYVEVEGPSGTQTGLARREVFIDARDVSSSDGAIAPATYLSMLQARGQDKWGEFQFIEQVDGEVTPYGDFIYGSDYDLGDIIRVEDRFGHSNPARVAEYTWVSDETGSRGLPTFTTI